MSPASNSAFSEWIAQGSYHKAGDWLVRTFAGEVLGLCGAMVRDSSTAEDLAQDVFGRAFSSLEGFRGEASARTWLLKIARNRCIDHLRAQHRDPFRDWNNHGDDPDQQPAETLLPRELLVHRADVEDALAELDEGDRALIVLRFRHGLEYAELAAAFGIKAGTARMRVSRALGKMRDALRPSRAERTTAAQSVRPRRAAVPASAPPGPPAAKSSRASRPAAAEYAPPPPPSAPLPSAPFERAVPPAPSIAGRASPLGQFFAQYDPGVPAAFAERLQSMVAGL